MNRNLLVTVLSVGVAVVLGVHLAVGHSEPAPDPRIQELTDSVAALQKAINDQSGRLASLERTVAQLPTQPADAQAPRLPDAPAPAVAAAPLAAAGPMRFTKFTAPGALTIVQSSGGDLVVTNTDPTLAGRTLNIDAFLEDGTAVPLTVQVPAATK